MMDKRLLITAVCVVIVSLGSSIYLSRIQIQAIDRADQIVKQQPTEGYFVNSCRWTPEDGWTVELGSTREEKKFKVSLRDYHSNFNSITDLCNQTKLKVEFSEPAAKFDLWAHINKNMPILIGRHLRFTSADKYVLTIPYEGQSTEDHTMSLVGISYNPPIRECRVYGLPTGVYLSGRCPVNGGKDGCVVKFRVSAEAVPSTFTATLTFWDADETHYQRLIQIELR